jgi:hypothetical protein
MSTPNPNPFEQAAIPSAIQIVEALQAFFTNLGTDPTQWAVKLPGAAQVLLGTVELQGPALAIAEAGALGTAVNTKLAAWLSTLQAAQAAQAAKDAAPQKS